MRLCEPTVSRKHAVFQVIDGTMVLKNMSTLNPVSLNDAMLDVNTAVRMRNGDVVGIQLTDDEEARFVFEQVVDSLTRSPLKEGGGNTPPSVSPSKQLSGDENVAPAQSQKSTPRRFETLSKLTGTPMPSKHILKQVSTLKKSREKKSRDSATKCSPTAPNSNVRRMRGDFDKQECGSPEGRAAITPKSPAKSVLKAPENRLAVRPSSIRRRSISFAGDEELEAIKWIAPHDGKVELCGRIAPLALDAPRSPRNRRSLSRSPNSTIKALPAPEVVLALPAPEQKRRSSISFKAVEDGDENETPDGAFTRSESRIHRRDTPHVSSRRKSRSPSTESTPVRTTCELEEVDMTESAATVTPPDQQNNLMSRLNIVATPSSEFKRPAAPHNTPVANEFNLDGFDLFRATPNKIQGIFEEDTVCDAIMRAVETMEAEAEEDISAVCDLDKALERLSTPSSTKKRVNDWLRAEGALAEIPDEVDERYSLTPGVEPSPAKSIVVAYKRRRSTKLKNGLSMRIEQLHRALRLTRRALSKERKRNGALKEMYFELLNTKENTAVSPEVKTPKVALQVNVRTATPPPPKTPKVVMQINVKEATPKTPKVVLNVSMKETTPSRILDRDEEPIAERQRTPVAASKKSSAPYCSACEVVDKCKTVSCAHCCISFHLKCLKPKLTRVPKGPWTCSLCPTANESKIAPSTKRAREVEAEPVRATRSSRRVKHS